MSEVAYSGFGASVFGLGFLLTAWKTLSRLLCPKRGNGETKKACFQSCRMSYFYLVIHVMAMLSFMVRCVFFVMIMWLGWDKSSIQVSWDEVPMQGSGALRVCEQLPTILVGTMFCFYLLFWAQVFYTCRDSVASFKLKYRPRAIMGVRVFWILHLGIWIACFFEAMEKKAVVAHKILLITFMAIQVGIVLHLTSATKKELLNVPVDLEIRKNRVDELSFSMAILLMSLLLSSSCQIWQLAAIFVDLELPIQVLPFYTLLAELLPGLTLVCVFSRGSSDQRLDSGAPILTGGKEFEARSTGEKLGLLPQSEFGSSAH